MEEIIVILIIICYEFSVFLKKSFCKIFGHKRVFSENIIYCKRCGKTIKKLLETEIKQYKRDEELKKIGIK
jgi:hypothetical protein